jgi:type II secretory pathway pseudopilin PulG
MHLAGQAKRPANQQSGYAMAALLVAMTIMAIMFTVAMPVWKQASTREKEEELVFRGEQIAHSIGMFQRKFANAYPPTLDETFRGVLVPAKLSVVDVENLRPHYALTLRHWRERYERGKPKNKLEGVRWAKPVWAEVKGDFRPRGGISTVVIARWPRPKKTRTKK